MNEIEDMLRDKDYSGTEIIDLIELLDIIEILQNPMVDSIVSNMYFGPYEREVILKKSTCFKVINENVNSSPGSEYTVTRSFKIFGAKNPLKSFFKYFKSQTKLYRNLCRNSTF